MSAAIQAPPIPQCDFLWEIWGPHPGCKEFMDAPEMIVQCHVPAGYVIQGEDVDQEGVTERTLHACGEHLGDLAEDCAFWRVLSVEPLL